MREGQSLSQQQEKSDAICRRILSQPLFSKENVTGKKIALYFAHKGEVDLERLKEYFLQNDGICYFPVTYPDQIIMVRYDPSKGESEQCRIGAMGIREPFEKQYDFKMPGIESGVGPFERMDWIFLPGIAFDLSGNRIGYGKGYYDRYLAQYDTLKQPMLIAPAYEFQIFDHISPEKHDRTVDRIVTEDRVIPTGSRK
jgi:5-formyltetrahydrofolate cyclo-ligase